MPTCSFMTKKGRVTFHTATRAKCRSSAVSSRHLVESDHRRLAEGRRLNESEARTARKSAPPPKSAPGVRASTRTRKPPARYK